MRVVSVRQALVGDRLGAAGAFCDVLAGQFDMHAARMGSLGRMHREKPAHLLENPVERPGFVPALRLDGVAVHRIAGPHHLFAFAFDGTDEFRQFFLDLFVAHPADQHQAAGIVPRVQGIDQFQQAVGGLARAGFQADRIGNPAHEIDMGAVELAGPVADPQQVRRRVVPVAGGRIDTRHGLFVPEQESFVAGIEVGFPKLRGDVRRQPAGRHERHRLVDTVGEFAVFSGLIARRHEFEIPAVYFVQIGIAALRKGAQQVQGRSGLVVHLHHAFRIGGAAFGGKRHVVDHIAAITGQRHAADFLDIGGTRFRELPGQTAHFHDGFPRSEGQHNRHLQQHTERIADIVRMKFGKAFCAIAALQQKCPAFRHFGELRTELARLAREHQRRIPAQFVFRGFQRGGVRIFRHLYDRLVPPAIRRPVARHGQSLFIRISRRPAYTPFERPFPAKPAFFQCLENRTLGED